MLVGNAGKFRCLCRLHLSMKLQCAAKFLSYAKIMRILVAFAENSVQLCARGVHLTRCECVTVTEIPKSSRDRARSGRRLTGEGLRMG
jgi:hypothetical protein